MTTIETLTGDVNLRTGSAKCFVFHTPHAGGKGAEERPLGLAAKSGQTSEVVRAVSPYPTVIPSVSGYSAEVGGKMVRMTYQVADGELIKLFVQRRPGAGKVPVSACQFIRVRESGALREVEMRLLTDACVNEPFGKLRGRFDLLTLAEARAMGATVASHFDSMFGEGSVSNTMSFSTIAAEKASAWSVAKDDGTVVVVAVAKRRRAINIKPIK